MHIDVDMFFVVEFKDQNEKNQYACKNQQYWFTSIFHDFYEAF